MEASCNVLTDDQIDNLHAFSVCNFPQFTNDRIKNNQTLNFFKEHSTHPQPVLDLHENAKKTGILRYPTFPNSDGITNQGELYWTNKKPNLNYRQDVEKTSGAHHRSSQAAKGSFQRMKYDYQFPVAIQISTPVPPPETAADPVCGRVCMDHLDMPLYNPMPTTAKPQPGWLKDSDNKTWQENLVQRSTHYGGAVGYRGGKGIKLSKTKHYENNLNHYNKFLKGNIFSRT